LAISVGEMDKIKLIHVGLGAWGGNWAAHVLQGHPEIETVAYVDMVVDKRERMAARTGEPMSKFFESLDAAVAATNAEAVSIAVPLALHEPLARQALEAGMHVVVEKPFTATMAEAKGLVALAAERNRILAVSQNYRFYPAARMVAELVRLELFRQDRRRQGRFPPQRLCRTHRQHQRAQPAARRHGRASLRPHADDYR